ncbi:glycosyltransferase family 39 protein [Calothrix sp. PCC 7507]|uniref:glycosyltransferase family 39 protein n=1 Tax=Calothrix sp. PCC 7507 TaxID=99598 RepID=UPI00029ED3A7|nr:glycosyltransferase family 39 protein [Calothrix sp. PCC 7507]AFY32821.1 glycosyl transferase family 39 [Calothrix sp. PCC 7507]
MQYLKNAPTWLRFLIVFMLVLGIFFRLFNLEHKVYWHDEVYTSMRAAGFTRQEIDKEIFQNQIIPVSELQKYQRLKPGSTAVDTIKSLEIEDPQHPPLYFLMARLWMQVFGPSLTASRTLPALLSLLALPLMYGLGIELFTSRTAALLATALVALSPFDILFAQTARQYSLLTVAVIGSSFLLLRALRLSTWQNWGLYILANTLGLYTHPFFGLTLIAQGTYALLLMTVKTSKNTTVSRNYIELSTLIAIASSLILYIPWLLVLKNNYQRVSDTTNWTRAIVDFLYLVKLWILSFTALFLDLDFGFNSIFTYLLRLLVLLLIASAIYTVCRQTNRPTWLFILTTIFVPFLLLVVPDLLLGGKRSAVSRYLISCYPGVQLAVAYLLATKILQRRRFWQGITLLLITGSIASSTVSAFSDTWWSKDLSYSNGEIARRINTINSPVLISDIGDDFTNTGDLISLSYLLHQDVQLLLVKTPKLEELNMISSVAKKSQTFFFRPSQKLVEAIKQEQLQMLPIFAPGRLWQLKN